MAQELLKKWQLKDPEKHEDTWLFTDGMIRSAVTWIESWIHVIDLAAKLHKQEDNIGFSKLLTNQFEESQHECVNLIVCSLLCTKIMLLICMSHSGLGTNVWEQSSWHS